MIIDKYKFQLVSRGFYQEKEIEYDEIFTPMGTIYLILVLASSFSSNVN